MGIFDKILGRKSSAPPEAVAEATATFGNYVEALADTIEEIDLSAGSAAKDLLAIYSFGGISVLASEHDLDVAQGHAVCLATYLQRFNYSSEDAAMKAEAVITAAPDRTSHLYAIIHRGLDGFLEWQEHGISKVTEDFQEIMGHFGNNG